MHCTSNLTTAGITVTPTSSVCPCSFITRTRLSHWGWPKARSFRVLITSGAGHDHSKTVPKYVGKFRELNPGFVVIAGRRTGCPERRGERTVSGALKQCAGWRINPVMRMMGLVSQPNRWPYSLEYIALTLLFLCKLTFYVIFLPTEATPHRLPLFTYSDVAVGVLLIFIVKS